MPNCECVLQQHHLTSLRSKDNCALPFFIQKLETIEYIPSSIWGDGNVLAEGPLLWHKCGFM